MFLEPVGSTQTQLKSTNIKSVEYFEDGTLWISFNAGSAYEYYHVPQNVVDELLQAESAGKYFHTFIRSIYRYKKIS